MLLTLLALMSAALPCAGIVHEDGVLAESDGAEILVQPTDGQVTVTYEVAYAGDAAEFAARGRAPVPAAPCTRCARGGGRTRSRQ